MTYFAPGVTVIISASAGASTAISIDGGKTALRIYNTGPSKAFGRWGVGTQSAVVTDMPVAPDSVEPFEKGAANSVAFICSASETAVLYITVGFGTS